jgi:hypothetical protein
MYVYMYVHWVVTLSDKLFSNLIYQAKVIVPIL